MAGGFDAGAGKSGRAPGAEAKAAGPAPVRAPLAGTRPPGGKGGRAGRDPKGPKGDKGGGTAKGSKGTGKDKDKVSKGPRGRKGF